MTPPADTARYKNHRFPGEIISHGVWLYYRFPLSYRDVQELLCERGHCQLNGSTYHTGLSSGMPSAFRSDLTTRSGMSVLQKCPMDPRRGRGFSAHRLS